MIAEDAYVENNFAETSYPLYHTVRKESDLGRFALLAHYSHVFKAGRALSVDFYWNFKRFTHILEEALVCEKLVSHMLSATAF